MITAKRINVTRQFKSLPTMYSRILKCEPFVIHIVWAIVHMPPKEDKIHTVYIFFRDRGIDTNAFKPEVISSSPDTVAYMYSL